MRHRKDIYISMPVIGLLLFFLLGCGGPFLAASGDSSDKKVTVTLWYWNRALDDVLIARVQQQFPAIRFRPLKIGGAMKLRTSLQSYDMLAGTRIFQILWPSMQILHVFS
ncbi:hypothetical protein KDW_44100 [Dictyobacter vulcani]|uniref:Uncharacterized protein n=1 Tax=Dictyobacter vulcani TaxID=2607529 RepID=A0A5J4KKG0_9CHLR|nr:hypothetical protein [Dictyobacter vulcani]GER90248.1 hypothetical protein KDW_44100 [Dictyobacter vulcani]